MLVSAPALFHPKCTFADTLYILPTFVRSETISREEAVSDDFLQKAATSVCRVKKKLYLCATNARMAESVDATVSNTVGATHPGSSPGPGTAEEKDISLSPPFYIL